MKKLALVVSLLCLVILAALLAGCVTPRDEFFCDEDHRCATRATLQPHIQC
jgi:hypothetical protein